MKNIEVVLKGAFGLTMLHYKEDGYFAFIYKAGDNHEQVYETVTGDKLAGYGETPGEALAALDEACGSMVELVRVLKS